MTESIIIGAVGDVIFTRPPSDRLFTRPLHDTDVRVANLEGPISDRGVPADKLINLRMPPGAGSWLKRTGFDVVSLANNHAMDYGIEGLKDTLRELADAGVAGVGAGNNLEEALQAHVTRVKGARVASIGLSATVPAGFAAADKRPGIAPLRVRVSFIVDGTINEEQPGTPPWVSTEVITEDLSLAQEAIRRARDRADIVLVQMHWGVPPEWNSPFQGELAEYQRPLAHALIDSGATVILGHHPHALHGVEMHRRALILYSLGNFAFHPYAERESLVLQRPSPPFRPVHSERNRQSLIARLTFGKDGGEWQLQAARLVPCRLDDSGEARELDEEEGASVLQAVKSSDANLGASLDIRDNEAVIVIS